MKTLILYYSLSGHTKRIAKRIQRRIGGEIAEIRTVKTYPEDFNDLVDEGQEETERGVLPELQPLGTELSSYDRIIIGTPVWWYTIAPAINSFLHNNDFTGKTVALFATNEGWLGHTMTDFARVCKGAYIKEGLDVLFKGDTLETKEGKIEKWAVDVIAE